MKRGNESKIAAFREQITKIKEDIAQKKTKPVYILMGEESYFIDVVTKEFEDNFIGEDGFREFNQTVLYGKETSVEDIISVARSYPMMAERRLVILKEAQQFKDLELLETYISKPVSSTVLVICYMHKKLEAKKTATKKMLSSKNVYTFVAERLNEDDIINWISISFKRKQIQIDLKASIVLHELIGNDMSRLHSEIEKMSLSLEPGSEVKVEEVSGSVFMSKEYGPFDLQSALSKNNRERAYKIMHYFSQPRNIDMLPVILSSLYSFICKIMIYHTEASRQNIKKPADIYNYTKVFDLNEFSNAVRVYSFDRCKKIIRVLHETDLKLKGVDMAGTDKTGLMKELVYHLLN